MKQLTRLIGVFLSISLSFNLLQAQDIDVMTKEKMDKVKFMSHLSVSIEAGTTGFGFEVATTLHPNFMLRAGFVIFPSFSIEAAGVDNRFYFDRLVDEMPEVKSELEYNELPTSFPFHYEIPMKDKFKLYNGKILIDYYPIAKRSFHITAGLYFGPKNIITSTGQLSLEYVKAIHVLNQYLPIDAQFSPMIQRGDLMRQSIYVKPSPTGQINYSLQQNSIRPYIGIGAGRAVPNKRISCQFDLGVIYQGKRRISSEYYVKYSSRGFLDFTIYPMLSVRLVGRIF